MRRRLYDEIELDDDPRRIDVDAVHAYISGESYWGKGRPRERVELAIRGSTRVLGLYDGDRQIGFARSFTDGVTMAYLADVYVLSEYRGRGLGLELVREAVEGGGGVGIRWMLHTADAQGLYEKLGFGTETGPYTLMERRRIDS